MFLPPPQPFAIGYWAFVVMLMWTVGMTASTLRPNKEIRALTTKDMLSPCMRDILTTAILSLQFGALLTCLELRWALQKIADMPPTYISWDGTRVARTFDWLSVDTGVPVARSFSYLLCGSLVAVIALACWSLVYMKKRRANRLLFAASGQGA